MKFYTNFVCNLYGLFIFQDECESIQEDLGAKLPLEIAPIIRLLNQMVQDFSSTAPLHKAERQQSGR